MSYVVFARKWRPHKFDEVIGQQHITQTLKNAINNNRIGHSYIFSGPRGVGKTTTARIFAKSLNCLNPQNAEPCNDCEMCQSFDSSQSMDIIEIDGASNRRIEDIRNLRETVKYSPTKGQYKIYIIDEVHMLTLESFNALLKTLEEPPEHTIFIFATTDIHKVPLTIISRCQRFDFRRIELEDIKGLLSKIADAENITIDDQSLTLIAKKADGALRDAQSLFDQVVSFCGNNIDSKILSSMLNLIDDDIYFSVSEAILQNDFKDAFNISKTIYENGWNFIDFLDGLIEHFRNILAVVVTHNTDLIESAEVYKGKYLSYRDYFSEGDLLRILKYLNNLVYEIKSTQNQRLKVEIGLSHLIGLSRTSTISKLIQKLENTNLSNLVDDSNKGETEKKKLNSKDNNQSENYFKEIPASTAEPAKSESTEITNYPENNELDKIKNNWESIVNNISDVKFTVGSLLTHCKPKSFNKETLVIACNIEDDIPILESHINIFKDAFSNLLNKNTLVRFIFSDEKISSNMESENINTTEINISEPDSELGNAIKDILGGKRLS